MFLVFFVVFFQIYSGKKLVCTGLEYFLFKSNQFRLYMHSNPRKYCYLCKVSRT